MKIVLFILALIGLYVAYIIYKSYAIFTHCVSNNAEQNFYRNLYARLSTKERQDFETYKAKRQSEFQKEGISDYITDDDIFISFIQSTIDWTSETFTSNAELFYWLKEKIDETEDKIYFLVLLKEFNTEKNMFEQLLKKWQQNAQKLRNIQCSDKSIYRQQFNDSICELLRERNKNDDTIS